MLMLQKRLRFELTLKQKKLLLNLLLTIKQFLKLVLKMCLP